MRANKKASPSGISALRTLIRNLGRWFHTPPCPPGYRAGVYDKLFQYRPLYGARNTYGCAFGGMGWLESLEPSCQSPTLNPVVVLRFKGFGILIACHIPRPRQLGHPIQDPDTMPIGKQPVRSTRQAKTVWTTRAVFPHREPGSRGEKGR